MGDRQLMRINEIVGSHLGVASEDGQKVHDQIAKALREDRPVELSFLNIDGLTSAFLNSAIGQLYGEFPTEEIRKNLSVTEMRKDDITLLKRVVDTAKEYFKDPKRFDQARKQVTGL